MLKKLLFCLIVKEGLVPKKKKEIETKRERGDYLNMQYVSLIAKR